MKPASLALMSQFRVLRENFNVEPMVCSGLPGFSQYAMYQLYNKDAPSIFTFHDNFEHVVKLFRENTLGGICNVYHRHLTTLDDPQAAQAAKFNKNGKFS